MIINCWNCDERIDVNAVAAADGYCPHCDIPIDLDDYEVEQDD